MTEKDVYQFYNEKVKVVYSEIEARNNTLPVELLFEIHSAFDHLKRFHIDDCPEGDCAKAAYSHLKRGVLDAFKLKLKYFNDDYNKLITKNKADLRIIDSGKFIPQMLHDRTMIIENAKKARLEESGKDINKAFEYWYTVSTGIDTFEASYFDSTKLQWAKKQSFFHFYLEFIVGVITGIISSTVVSFIFQKLQK
jgi:hypothetical protein